MKRQISLHAIALIFITPSIKVLYVKCQEKEYIDTFFWRCYNYFWYQHIDTENKEE